MADSSSKSFESAENCSRKVQGGGIGGVLPEYAAEQRQTLFPIKSLPQESLLQKKNAGIGGKAGKKQTLSIRRVFIYANPSKPNTANCLQQLVGILKKQGVESLIYNEPAPSRADMIEYIARALSIPLHTKSQEYYGDHPEEPFVGLNGREIFDLVITVGGDGTVLKYLSYSPFREIPILPINTGSLGYITSISFQNIAESMKIIFSGAFVYSRRTLLKACLADNQGKSKHYREHFALNEIAISAFRAGLLADMELQVGSASIPVQGDGIIVATPTGSTAYSLAAGGPIVDAEMEALIITPVSPFSLATRPVVTPSHVHLLVRNVAESKNTLVDKQVCKNTKNLGELDSNEAPLSVAIDGWALGQLYPGESIQISGSSEHIQFLAMSHNNSYFENIRTKLGWHNVAYRQVTDE